MLFVDVVMVVSWRLVLCADCSRPPRRFDVFVDGVHVAEYKGSGIFGELALLHNCPRAATVMSTGHGKLWCLDRQQFCESSRLPQQPQSPFCIWSGGPVLWVARGGVFIAVPALSTLRDSQRPVSG